VAHLTLLSLIDIHRRFAARGVQPRPGATWARCGELRLESARRGIGAADAWTHVHPGRASHRVVARLSR